LLCAFIEQRLCFQQHPSFGPEHVRKQFTNKHLLALGGFS
jgi:hypothetical protein